MASIPLPALDVKPPAPTQANPLQQYAEMMGLRNEMQEQPLRQQALQNQVQAGTMENQKTQIQLNDAKAMRAAMQQWGKNQGAPQSPASGADPGSFYG